MSRALEERIAAVAARQHGVITHRQLTDAGLSDSAVARRLASGRMRPLHRGVYLAGAVPLARTREMAAVLAVGADATVSHFSAGALWRLRPVPGADATEPVHVVVTVARGGRHGIRIHQVRRLTEEDRTTRDGIPVTTPLRTLLDLAAVLDKRELELTVARAERDGLVTDRALAAAVARRGHRGTPALAAVLGITGGPALTRSEAEEKLLGLIREARLPAPECNSKVGPYEVDFLWRAARLAVEVDGFRYHSSKPSFEGDRRKDAELVARGLTVLRLSWRQITGEAMATVAQVAQALACAGRRR